MVHTKEKNFACEFCGKRFGLKQNMKVHEKIHFRGGRKPKAKTKDSKESDPEFSEKSSMED